MCGHLLISSDVNKDLGPKTKFKGRGHKAKAVAKDLGSKAKDLVCHGQWQKRKPK